MSQHSLGVIPAALESGSGLILLSISRVAASMATGGVIGYQNPLVLGNRLVCNGHAVAFRLHLSIKKFIYFLPGDITAALPSRGCGPGSGVDS